MIRLSGKGRLILMASIVLPSLKATGYVICMVVVNSFLLVTPTDLLAPPSLTKSKQFYLFHVLTISSHLPVDLATCAALPSPARSSGLLASLVSCGFCFASVTQWASERGVVATVGSRALRERL